MGPDLPPTFEQARPLLTARPLGRTPLGLTAWRLAAGGAQTAADAARPIAADLLVGAILDLPEVDVPVTEGMLRDWGVSLDDVIAAATANRSSVQPRVQPIEGAYLVSSVPYAAYALQTPEAVATLVPGRTPVILVPTTGELVVAAAEDPAGLHVAVRVAERILQSDNRGVSVTPLVRDGSRWVPFEWPGSVAPVVRVLRQRWDVAQYAAQRPLLQAHYAGGQQDYAVAEAAMFAAPDGTTVTSTTLVEGAPTVLPWVEEVVLVAESGAAQRVPMAELARIPGLLVRLPDLDPARMYASRFPTELLPPAR